MARSFGRPDRGGGGIEMAIIMPLLLFSVFGVAHLGMYYLARQAALSVAQVAVEGERAWQAEPGAGQRRADRFLDQLPGVLEAPEVEVSTDGAQVVVTVRGDAISVLPWPQFRVEQTAAGPVERLT